MAMSNNYLNPHGDSNGWRYSNLVPDALTGFYANGNDRLVWHLNDVGDR
jgi:hypothetical protein